MRRAGSCKGQRHAGRPGENGDCTLDGPTPLGPSGGFVPCSTRLPRASSARLCMGVMSRRLLLITFSGRKSGKQYTTPIRYVQRGNIVLLGEGRRWWKNLCGDVPVQVRL